MTSDVSHPQHGKAVVALWFIPLLWSVNLLVARMAPGLVSPHVLAAGRWMIAGTVLLVLARQERRMIAVVLRAHPWRYVLMGACGMWICGAWVYIAGQSTSALNLSLIYSSAPVMIAVGSVWWLGERMRAAQRLGVVLALVGVVHVVVRGDWLRLSEAHFVVGDLWVSAAAVSWAAFALLQKRWQAPISATAQLTAITAGGVAVLLPFAAWELTLSSTPPLSWQAMGLMLVTGLLPGVGAYWIYTWTQRILGASRVGMTLYLSPLYAAVMGWLALGEPMGSFHVWGGALILGGVALVTVRRSKG